MKPDTHGSGNLGVCVYGCGMPALYLIGGLQKPCCQVRFTLCSAYRERAAERQLGSNNSFYGKKHSEETRVIMSSERMGKKNAFYGKQHSEATKEQISEERKGKAVGTDNPRFGKKRSQKVKDKIGETRVRLGLAKGENNPNYRHGKASSRKCDMATRKYRQWREAVFTRDDYTCQFCGKRGGDLEADHIKAWAFFKSLRYAVNNGRTLCVHCHRTTFKDVFSQRAANG